MIGVLPFGSQRGPRYTELGRPRQSLVPALRNSRNSRILLIEQNLGVWTFEDARREFGPAATQEERGDRSNNTDVDLYRFRSEASGFPLISLSFYRASGKLVTATLSPAGMNREHLIGLIGNDYVGQRDSSNNRVCVYRDR
jgi:hypothetical protein